MQKKSHFALISLWLIFTVLKVVIHFVLMVVYKEVRFSLFDVSLSDFLKDKLYFQKINLWRRPKFASFSTVSFFCLFFFFFLFFLLFFLLFLEDFLNFADIFSNVFLILFWVFFFFWSLPSPGQRGSPEKAKIVRILGGF